MNKIDLKIDVCFRSCWILVVNIYGWLKGIADTISGIININQACIEAGVDAYDSIGA